MSYITYLEGTVGFGYKYWTTAKIIRAWYISCVKDTPFCGNCSSLIDFAVVTFACMGINDSSSKQCSVAVQGQCCYVEVSPLTSSSSEN